MSPPLSQLLDVHRALEAHFAAHQAALLDRDLSTASDHLANFIRRLASHINDEEAWMLPAYEALPHTTERYAKLYHGEHQKLLKIAHEIEDRVAALSRPPSAAEIIAVLDRECFFKDLLSHHDVREQNDLYAALDKHLTEAERDVIWMELSTPKPAG